jgi:hypothetical protein
MRECPVPRTILSLCDGTGAWSKPYRDAGYEIIAIDLPSDVRLMKVPTQKIHGILAAPPCTVFALSGVSWHRTKGEMLHGLGIVSACLRIITACAPSWWALENPVGTLVHYLGPPVDYFDPCDYGDPYTKRTALWGKFTMPTKDRVIPTEGSKTHFYGPTKDRAIKRSITPTGFANAFANVNP